ncbi:MAG: NAD(P)H-dependent oxidoreductase [Deltaproteobacteria bacterium]|jgi:hypothetical protein|nr:NAD(P)H-dependent oxidoreductase [Deltaproteobacteria bacterium]
MRLTLLNGSPKTGESASSIVLEIALEKLSGPDAVVQTAKAAVSEKDPASLPSFPLFPILESDAILVSFPLYFDGPPSGLVRFLEKLAAEAREARGSARGTATRLYGIVNCGFHETDRSNLALETLKIFAASAGFVYGRGLSLGGGPFISMTAKTFRRGGFPFGKQREAMDALFESAGTLSKGPDLEGTVSLPRSLYNIGANIHWKMLAKKEGNKTKDLYR